MPVKSLMFLTSALISAGWVIEPLAAGAASLRQTGTWGSPAGPSRGSVNQTAGEITGCLPGAALKVIVGAVMMSDQGMAASRNDGHVLTHVARVCIEQRREMVGAVRQVSPSYSNQVSQEQRMAAAATAKARELGSSG